MNDGAIGEGNESGNQAAGIRFPAYDVADRRLRQKVFEARRKADPLLGQIDIVESEHAGPIRSVGGEAPYDSPFQQHAVTTSITVVDVENMNFKAYVEMLWKASDELLELFAKTFFGEMGAITKHVGNVVDGSGKSLFEQFKEGMMKWPLEFDDHGGLLAKQLVVHPDMHQQAKKAMSEVFADKDVQDRIASERDAFLASRGKRRLLSPC